MEDSEPTFEEYVAARKVVFFKYAQLRAEKYRGKLSIAHDEMVARIVTKSYARFRCDASEEQSFVNELTQKTESADA